MKLTEHFELSEFAVSTQYPSEARRINFCHDDIVKLFYLCSTLLEPARKIGGDEPIVVLSGKRTPKLNSLIGGAVKSDHLYEGYSCAADFTTHSKGSLYSIFRFLIWECHFSVGQAILYFTREYRPRFIHVSLVTPKHHSEFLYEHNHKFRNLVDLPSEIYAKIFEKEVF